MPDFDVNDLILSPISSKNVGGRGWKKKTFSYFQKDIGKLGQTV